MTIYIQSRGISQDNDYRWLKINQNQSEPENPQVLLQSIDNLSVKPIELIDSQKFSIILLSLSNDFCLLVTGLKARKERTDFMGRPIRNSVLWIGKKDSENELKARSLLIRALRGELEREIDKTISISGNYGFEVDYKLLKDLFNSTLVIANNQNTDLNSKIGNNSELLRQEIALELENNALPNRQGLLVLVTSIKSALALKKTGVWRGLSNRVEYEKFKEYGFLNTTKSQAQKKTIFLILAIAIVSLVAIALSIIKFTTPQQPQPEIIPTPSTIQKNSLTTSKKELNRALNPIKTREINYLTSSYIFKKDYGI